MNSRIEILRCRICDLRDRLELLNYLTAEEYERWAIGFIDYSFSDQQLLVCDITDLFRAADIEKAIQLAEEELDVLICAENR